MSSSYNRNTELRNVQTKDLYNLAVILDDDNYWQTLMEIIPKELNNQTFGTAQDLEKISSGSAYERKYNNDHIRLIENAIRRPGESRLYSQILFDEWGSSGRKHERPTLGVLLHLLVQSKLYRAADFVAELLNEPKPQRPANGPAAEFEFEIDVFNDIQEAVNDSRFYPNTEDLQENINIDDIDINKDYYTKYHKNVDKKIPTINDITEEPKIMTAAPKPPPRLLKSARLLKQQQLQQQQQQQQLSTQLLQQTANKNDINNKSPNIMEEQVQQQQQIQQLNTHSNNESMSALSSTSTNNMPKLSALMNSTNSIINTTTTTTMTTTNYTSEVSENLLPKLSALNNSSERISQPYQDDDEDNSLNSTPSLIYTKPNIVQDHDQQHSDLNSIPIVVLSKPLNIDIKQEQSDNDNNAEINDDLPAISALNLNGERDDVLSGQNQLSNNFENAASVALNYTGHRRASFEECAVHDEDLNIPCLVANMNFNENSSRHQLEAIEEDYNGIEHEHDNDGVEAELDEDEDSIPNLSFLENRSSNNESSLTSVTNTSGDNSFEQSVNDCSSTSTDNVPFLSVFNQ